MAPAEWLSGDRSSLVQWSQHATSGSIYHEIDLQSPQPFVEINHQAQDGTAYYAMANTPGLTWQIAQDVTCRGQFHDHGNLTGTFTTSFASISPVFTVYAIAVDLGVIQSTSNPVTWAVGYVRNPTIQYTTADGITQKLSPYFVTKYGTNIGQAIDAITSAYPDVLQKAVAFDEAIIANASTISPHYADLVSLALRQTMGSLDITVPISSDGTANASDVRIFMKDVGASTSAGRVSPVERIYAALPALLYVNASLVGPLLAPLLDAQDSLELRIPTQQAHMAHTRKGLSYNLTKRWADYLVANSLTPNNQYVRLSHGKMQSTDDTPLRETADNEGNANMTNLAIKGIIGVKAMAEISRALGQDLDAQQYDSHAAALVGSWQSLASSADQTHLLGFYGNQKSWALLYNIYADRLLGTDILLKDQTAFYQTLLQSSHPYGVPLDSSIGDVTSAAWQMFTAAIVQDDNVRNGFVDGVWARANDNFTAGAFPDSYDATTGDLLSGTAGPAAGAMFSLLALNLTNKTISASSPLTQQDGPGKGGNGGSNGEGSAKGTTPVGAIAGGVVGGIVILALAGLGLFLFMRRRRRGGPRTLEEDEKFETMMQDPHRPTLSPYTYSPSGPSPLSYAPPALDSGTFSHPSAASQERIGSNQYLMPQPVQEDPVSRQSSKERERERNTRLQYAASTSGSSNVASNSWSASSREPLSPGMTRSTQSGSMTGTSVSPPDVLGLRAEVENLRRVMQELRADRLEPPPEYAG
ncbi:hypothetical protein BN946_scf185042.g112 [Trametes cinnabarina]|uniref:receptor protein-tyrosine kinase n=1 Tax=Pycnoporus cinnabarinus TaxID=5643 RepID=A0A060S4E4_PYCCI|nr:hypothetical protein BN946_scf185042.g112 [Trametes cinnabarina]